MSLTLKDNYRDQFSFDKLKKEHFREFYINNYGTGELEEASGYEFVSDEVKSEKNIFKFIDTEIGWDSMRLIEYFECDDDLFEIWFDEYIVETIGAEKLIGDFGEPWDSKHNKIDRHIYDYYYEEFFNDDVFFKELLKYDKIDIDVEEEYAEYIKQYNIKKFKI